MPCHFHEHPRTWRSISWSYIFLGLTFLRPFERNAYMLYTTRALSFCFRSSPSTHNPRYPSIRTRPPCTPRFCRFLPASRLHNNATISSGFIHRLTDNTNTLRSLSRLKLVGVMERSSFFTLVTRSDEKNVKDRRDSTIWPDGWKERLLGR